MEENTDITPVEQSSSFLDVEIEALKSIYINETDVLKDDSTTTLSIDLHPATADNFHEQFVKMTLKLMIQSGYPEVVPEINIRNPRGLSDEKLASITDDLIKIAESKKGNSMLFQIIEAAKDHLTAGNRPCGECAICLCGFHENDVFTKTECYHYFHSHCLARYSKTVLKNTTDSNSDEEVTEKELLCPVCRLPIHFEESDDTYPPPVTSGDECVLSDAILELQKKMQELYLKQVDKGGIIDLEAEKNKYLLEISQANSATEGTPQSKLDDESIVRISEEKDACPTTSSASKTSPEKFNGGRQKNMKYGGVENDGHKDSKRTNRRDGFVKHYQHDRNRRYCEENYYGRKRQENYNRKQNDTFDKQRRHGYEKFDRNNTYENNYKSERFSRDRRDNSDLRNNYYNRGPRNSRFYGEQRNGYYVEQRNGRYNSDRRNNKYDGDGGNNRNYGGRRNVQKDSDKFGNEGDERSNKYDREERNNEFKVDSTSDAFAQDRLDHEKFDECEEEKNEIRPAEDNVNFEDDYDSRAKNLDENRRNRRYESYRKNNRYNNDGRNGWFDQDRRNEKYNWERRNFNFGNKYNKFDRNHRNRDFNYIDNKVEIKESDKRKECENVHDSNGIHNDANDKGHVSLSPDFGLHKAGNSSENVACKESCFPSENASDIEESDKIEDNSKSVSSLNTKKNFRTPNDSSGPKSNFLERTNYYRKNADKNYKKQDYRYSTNYSKDRSNVSLKRPDYHTQKRYSKSESLEKEISISNNSTENSKQLTEENGKENENFKKVKEHFDDFQFSKNTSKRDSISSIEKRSKSNYSKNFGDRNGDEERYYNGNQNCKEPQSSKRNGPVRNSQNGFSNYSNRISQNNKNSTEKLENSEILLNDQAENNAKKKQSLDDACVEIPSNEKPSSKSSDQVTSKTSDVDKSVPTSSFLPSMSSVAPPPGFQNPARKIVYGLAAANPPPGFHRS